MSKQDMPLNTFSPPAVAPRFALPNHNYKTKISIQQAVSSSSWHHQPPQTPIKHASAISRRRRLMDPRPPATPSFSASPPPSTLKRPLHMLQSTPFSSSMQPPSSSSCKPALP
eukprot:scaffold3928_cov214-Alexandrium_tamarense.AAC.1